MDLSSIQYNFGMNNIHFTLISIVLKAHKLQLFLNYKKKAMLIMIEFILSKLISTGLVKMQLIDQMPFIDENICEPSNPFRKYEC